MQFIQSDHTKDSCLRFVFDDAVVSFDLAVDATFEDIARVLGELMSRHHGNPIAIDVTMAGRGGGADVEGRQRPEFARRMLDRWS